MKHRLLAAALIATAAPAFSQTASGQAARQNSNSMENTTSAQLSQSATADAAGSIFPYDVAGVRLGMSPQQTKDALATSGYRVGPDGLSYGPSFASTVKQSAEQRRTGNYTFPSMADRVVTRIAADGPKRERVLIFFAPSSAGSSVVTDVSVDIPTDVMTGPAMLRQAITKYGKPDGGSDGGMTIAWCPPAMKSVCGRVIPFGADWGALPNLQATTVLNDNSIKLSEGTQRSRQRSQELAAAIERAAPKTDQAAF